MPLKKIFKIIKKSKSKDMKDKFLVINRLRPKSTLTGRKKIEELKKIGKEKREGKKRPLFLIKNSSWP